MTKRYLLGNEAIAHAAIEASADFVSGYPGTPSSEVIDILRVQEERPLYVEWSVNEKVAFELLEALRYRHYLKTGGTLVANRLIQVPTSVFVQKLETPTIEGTFGELTDLDPCILDADKKAVEAGSPLTQNMVMVGAGSLTIPLKVEFLEEAIRRLVPKKTIAMNLRAFRLGRGATGGCR